MACVVVHHSSKNGASYRGSSNLATTFEIILGLTHIDNILDDHGGAAFKTEFTKVRNVRHASLSSREVRLVSALGESRWETKADEDETLKAIVEVIRSGKCSRQSDIATHLPLRFWPNKESAPSVGWISNRVREIKVKGLLRDYEIKAAFDVSVIEDGLDADYAPPEDHTFPTNDLGY